jgi:DHA1 family bicyclomycin/chloramphenicol resistance-like MFS transporter
MRQSIGNTIVQTLGMGALFAFINSIQQIVFNVFDRPELIGVVFAPIAGPMAVSSSVNSRLWCGWARGASCWPAFAPSPDSRFFT